MRLSNVQINITLQKQTLLQKLIYVNKRSYANVTLQRSVASPRAQKGVALRAPRVGGGEANNV